MKIVQRRKTVVITQNKHIKVLVTVLALLEFSAWRRFGDSLDDHNNNGDEQSDASFSYRELAGILL